MATETTKFFALILANGLLLIGIALLYLLARNFAPGQTQEMPGFPEVLFAAGGIVVFGAFLLRNRKAGRPESS